MSKTKTRKTVKTAKATKPGKAVKAVSAKAPRTVASKPLRPHTLRPTQPAPRPKRPAARKPAADAAPAQEVIIKTIKWSAADLKQFRERLQRLHDVAVDDIGFLSGGHLANSADGVAGKSAGGGQDRTEDGTENFAQDLSLMQVSNKQDMLNEILDALRRLEQRTYGSCVECGQLIAVARLNAQPFATRCIKCQSAAEVNRPRSQGFRKSMVQIVETEAAEVTVVPE